MFKIDVEELKRIVEEATLSRLDNMVDEIFYEIALVLQREFTVALQEEIKLQKKEEATAVARLKALESITEY